MRPEVSNNQFLTKWMNFDDLFHNNLYLFDQSKWRQVDPSWICHMVLKWLQNNLKINFDPVYRSHMIRVQPGLKWTTKSIFDPLYIQRWPIFALLPQTAVANLRQKWIKMGILVVSVEQKSAGVKKSGSKGHTWKSILIHFWIKRFPTFEAVKQKFIWVK